MKNNPQNGEKYLQFIQHIRDLYPEYANNPYKSTILKTNYPFKKEAKDPNRRFSTEDIEMSNNHVKIHPASLGIRKCSQNPSDSPLHIH